MAQSGMRGKNRSLTVAAPIRAATVRERLSAARQATGSTGPAGTGTHRASQRYSGGNREGPEEHAVLSTTNPVMAGAATPARFPTKFCKPDHRPRRGAGDGLRDGPVLDANTPYDMQPSIRKTMDATGLETQATPRMIVAPPNPLPCRSCGRAWCGAGGDEAIG